MSRALIDKFYADHEALQAYLLDKGEASFAVDSGNNFRRALVLAIASFFEHEVCDIVRSIPSRHAHGNVLISSLLEAKAIKRQYHTYFDWDNLSANGFFGLFGSECRADFQSKAKKDDSFKASVDAFLQLGQMRNRLVHQNFVQFDVDKTPADIKSQFELALPFVEYIRHTLLGQEDSEVAVREIAS